MVDLLNNVFFTLKTPGVMIICGNISYPLMFVIGSKINIAVCLYVYRNMEWDLILGLSILSHLLNVLLIVSPLTLSFRAMTRAPPCHSTQLS